MKLEEIVKEYFEQNPQAFTQGIDEDEFIAEFQYEGLITTIRKALKKCGLLPQSIVDQQTGQKYRLLLPYNYEKNKDWMEIYNERFIPTTNY